MRQSSIIVAAVAVLFADVASAQEQARSPVTIAGVVRDTSGHELVGAEIRVGTRYVISNPDGKFVLDSVPPDTIALEIRRIGYEVEGVLLVANPGDRVEIAVRLTPVSVTLSTIFVEGKRVYNSLLTNGWYDREKLGAGVQFGPDVMERFSGTMSGLIYNVPGVRIERGMFGKATAFATGGRECALKVFLDGHFVSMADEIGLDNIIGLQEVLAVEVYRNDIEAPQNVTWYKSAEAATPPPPRGGADMRVRHCGAIMIWTKPFTKDNHAPPKPRGGRAPG